MLRINNGGCWFNLPRDWRDRVIAALDAAGVPYMPRGPYMDEPWLIVIDGRYLAAESAINAVIDG